MQHRVSQSKFGERLVFEFQRQKYEYITPQNIKEAVRCTLRLACCGRRCVRMRAVPWVATGAVWVRQVLEEGEELTELSIRPYLCRP